MWSSARRLTQSLYRRATEASERQSRARLVIPVEDRPSDRPAIYFLTPDYQEPAGGIRVIYRHVDILNDGGIPAFVLHQRRGFRCNWFENQTQVVDVTEARIRQGDLLVVSELDVDLLYRLPPGTRHVIFNQNSHLTWRRASSGTTNHYICDRDLAAVVTVSQHNQDMLQYAFPGTPVHRIRLGLDAALFHAGPISRGRRIGYMPRRGREDAAQVFEMLYGRGVLDGWDIVSLSGLSHQGVAEALRTTRIFLAFTSQEGFGLPAAEAMACGNYVIGQHGYGGQEFFLPEFSAAIAPGDTFGFAEAVEAAILQDGHTPGCCAERGRRASRFILSEYTADRERRDVTMLYAGLLSDCSTADIAAQ